MEQNFVSRTLVIALGLQLFSSILYSQSSAINNQFWLQMPLLNAAASGVFNDVEAASGIQFGGTQASTNIIDAVTPEIFCRADIFVDKLNSGFGLNYYNTNLSQLFSPTNNFVTEQRIGLNYNYQLRFNQNNLLSAGLCLDMKIKNWNSELMYPETGKETAHNLGAGLLFKNKYWFAGASFLPVWRIKEYDFAEYYINLFTLTAGADIPINQRIKISSGINYTSGNYTIWAFNANLSLKFEDIFYAGAGIQKGNYYNESWQLFIGLQVSNNLLIHYSYGHIFNDFNFDYSAQQNIAVIYTLSRKT